MLVSFQNLKKSLSELLKYQVSRKGHKLFRYINQSLCILQESATLHQRTDRQKDKLTQKHTHKPTSPTKTRKEEELSNTKEVLTPAHLIHALLQSCSTKLESLLPTTGRSKEPWLCCLDTVKTYSINPSLSMCVCVCYFYNDYRVIQCVAGVFLLKSSPSTPKEVLVLFELREISRRSRRKHSQGN